MPKARLLLGLPIALVAVLALAFGLHRRATAPDALLDRVEFEFRDHHEGGRTVAMVGVELLRTAKGQGRLRVVPRPVGALVEPVPGFRGVAGTNLQSARELDQLVERVALELLVRPRAEGEVLAGSVLAVERSALPARSLRPDGRIDFEARTSLEHVVSVSLESPSFGGGAHVAEVHAGGNPRLTIEFSFDGNHGHIGPIHGQAEPGETEAQQ